LKCDSRRGDAIAAVAAIVLVAAVAGPSAQSRSAATTPSAWMACAGPGQGTSYPVHRLTALTDKALVQDDISRVFAQREKDQRVAPERLASARLSIDFLYAAGEGQTRIFYYEASKTIPDAEGLVRVSVAGWLRGEGGQPRSLGAKSELNWLELAEESFGDKEIPEPAPIPDPAAALVPLGVLGQAGGHVWVMRRAIGTGTVLVYDVGPGGVSLRPRTNCKL
jgi:hypothetical protein